MSYEYLDNQTFNVLHSTLGFDGAEIPLNFKYTASFAGRDPKELRDKFHSRISDECLSLLLVSPCRWFFFILTNFKSMLQMDPTKRCSALDALTHPFFDSHRQELEGEYANELRAIGYYYMAW
jgi:hypothetical protein